MKHCLGRALLWSLSCLAAPGVFGDRGLPFEPIAGLDVIHSLPHRITFAAGLRYAFAARPENQRYLGVGAHVWRLAAGIRVHPGD
jgi:hypothetical protein